MVAGLDRLAAARDARERAVIGDYLADATTLITHTRHSAELDERGS